MEYNTNRAQEELDLLLCGLCWVRRSVCARRSICAQAKDRQLGALAPACCLMGLTPPETPF